MLKETIKTLISSFISGILISIGGIVFLSVESKYLGALLFSVGLFFIVEFGFKLYTGAIGYALDSNKTSNLMLPIIVIGNFLGTFFISFLMHFTRYFEVLHDKAYILTDAKVNDTWYSILILSIMCGIMIYLGVNVFKKSENYISKVFAIIICVVVFILSGFEHSIADMFYFSISDMWTIKSVLYTVLIITGNSIGGLLIPSLVKFVNFIRSKVTIK